MMRRIQKNGTTDLELKGRTKLHRDKGVHLDHRRQCYRIFDVHHHVRIYPWALKAIFGSIAWCGHISGFLSRTITPCDFLAFELGVRYLVFACARFLKVSEGQARCFLASRVLQFSQS